MHRFGPYQVFLLSGILALCSCFVMQGAFVIPSVVPVRVIEVPQSWVPSHGALLWHLAFGISAWAVFGAAPLPWRCCGSLAALLPEL